jgi:diguanylate cyclase (GGDEF)-like protein
MKSEGELKKLLDKIHLNVNKLYHVATHDEKTGLHNHVFFKEVLMLELEKARRGKSLSLIIADIDFFKKVNDTYGHLTADKILQKLAKVLEKQLRIYDVAARFGGEEFFIMLPNTKLSKARKIAVRLLRAVHKDSMLSRYKITVSMGVADYNERDNFERLSNRADKALYRAKRTGRNRVCV